MAVSFSNSENTPLIRVNYSNDALWTQVLADARRVSPDSFGGDFVANVEVFDSRELDGADPLRLAKQAAEENVNVALCVFADETTMTHHEHPLLCIDLMDFNELRVVPSEFQSIENNLSAGTAEMSQFAIAADKDGIFRGFKK